MGPRVSRRLGGSRRETARLDLRASALTTMAQRVGLGALLVGRYQEDELVFAGKVGTGFDVALLRALRARLDSLEIPTSPFTKAVGLPRLRAHWVRPEIVVDVAFVEWTVHGKLRHPRLLGVRS